MIPMVRRVPIVQRGGIHCRISALETKETEVMMQIFCQLLLRNGFCSR